MHFCLIEFPFQKLHRFLSQFLLSFLLNIIIAGKRELKNLENLTQKPWYYWRWNTINQSYNTHKLLQTKSNELNMYQETQECKRLHTDKVVYCYKEKYIKNDFLHFQGFPFLCFFKDCKDFFNKKLIFKVFKDE